MRADHERPIVLVVEDDPLIRSDMVSEFNWRGWHVLDTPTGEEALALAGDNDIDVIVTDIQLGGLLSGWDVAEEMRNVDPDVPVIYTSGNAPNYRRLVCGALFFGKPCDPVKVVDTSHRLRRERA
jgi:CheY-like chemotaxis protein